MFILVASTYDSFNQPLASAILAPLLFETAFASLSATMLSVPILIAFLTITVVPGPPVSVAASVPLPLASSLATLASNLTATNNATTGDGFILNFALTLEYLQRAFYVSGLNNFTHSDFTTAGFLDPFYDDLVQISNEEQSHIDFLVEALEAADIEATLPLEYMFPYMDVSAFVSLSSIIEGVSVSAYVITWLRRRFLD